MKLTTSRYGVLEVKESANSLLESKLEELDLNSHNEALEDISDMQLEHALALQEQVQELESESEAV